MEAAITALTGQLERSERRVDAAEIQARMTMERVEAAEAERGHERQRAVMAEQRASAAGLGLFILDRMERHPLQFLWAKTLLALACIVLLAIAVISAHLNTALGVLLQSGTVLVIAREHWRARPASSDEDRVLREFLTYFEAEAEQQRERRSAMAGQAPGADGGV